MSLPPWIRSIKRPLDKVVQPVVRRTSFEDLPDTEPGEELGERGRTPVGRQPTHPARARSDAPEDETGDDASDEEPPVLRGLLELV